MKLEFEIPAGVIFRGIYCRGDGWGAILSCTPGFWPSRYRENYPDPRDEKYRFHSCSAGDYGYTSAQAAIDGTFEKLKASMAFLDGIGPPPKKVKAPEPKLDSSALAGIDLGGLDL